MADWFLLSKVQMRRIEWYFPLLHGIARVDDRRIVSAIVFVIKNGLRWRDAPPNYGPHKTIYNRFIRSSRLDVFNKQTVRKLLALMALPIWAMADGFFRLLLAATGPVSTRNSLWGLVAADWARRPATFSAGPRRSSA